jgi:hypothetical protein
VKGLEYKPPRVVGERLVFEAFRAISAAEGGIGIRLRASSYLRVSV